VLAVDFVEAESAPSFSNISLGALTTSSVTVTMTLSGTGVIYCGVFDSGTVPSSSSAIILQNNVTVATNGKGVITISELTPATDYDIYCLTQTLLGVTMSYSDILLTKKSVTTLCCRELLVSVDTTSVTQYESLVNAISFVLEETPTKNLTVSMYTNGTALTPKSITFTSSSTTLTGSFSVTTANTQNEGNMLVTVVLSGTSAGNYEAVFDTTSYITVLSASSDPVVPSLTYAYFSNDGSQLLIQFDEKTNKGGITTSTFACSSLFSFPGVSSYCQWTSRSLVTATLGSSATVLVGDTLELSGGKIKAACATGTAQSICDAYATAAAQSVSVGSPLKTLTPSVTINAPDTISTCADLIVDLTSSTGSGGRAWYNQSVQIFSDNDVTALLTWLMANYDVSPPTAVPASEGLLSQGQYNYIATLCNFFGECGYAASTVVVVNSEFPTVSIYGSTLRSKARPSTLSIKSDAYVTTCNGTTRRSNITYFWQPYIYDTYYRSVLTFTSSSVESNSYKLSPYTLSVSEFYKFTVQAYDDLTGTSASTYVEVFVYQSSLVAVLDGGSSRGLRLLETLSLNASNSYDEDIEDLVGVAAGLSFSWSCFQSEPNVNSSCSFTMSSASDTAAIELYAPSTANGTESIVTVTVFDSTRSDSASVTVYASTGLAPSVLITSTFPDDVEVTDTLTITGTITTSVSGTSTWSIDDDSITLADVSSSAVTKTQTVTGSSEETFVVNLVIAPDSLAEQATYVFTLISTLENKGQAYATVTVTTNGSPLPGTFTVAPVTGYSIQTLFTFSADGWTDIDLPLTYRFGFVSNSGVSKVLRTFTESTYLVSPMSAGLVANNYTKQTQLEVADVYNSISTVTADIVVYQSTTRRKLQSVSSSTLTTINDYISSAENNDQVQQIVSIGGDVMNTVTCTSAPDCESLNRYSCASTTDTCGECYTSFIGDAGDANTPCVNASNIISSKVGESCSSSSACGSFESCISNVCVLESKSCAGNCTGRGSCFFINSYSGSVVDECYNGDATCAAVCSCYSGYTGSVCAYTDDELTAAQDTRLNLLFSLQDLIASSDITRDEIVTWVSDLTTLATKVDELSAIAIDVAANISETILVAAASSNIKYYYFDDNLLDAFDKFLAYYGYNVISSMGRRRLDTVDQQQLINKFSALVLNTMVDGQDAVDYYMNEFTVTNQVLTPSGGTVLVSGIVSEYDALSGVEIDQALISVGSSVQSAGIAAISVRSLYYGTSSSSYVSNPFHIVFKDTSVCPFGRCELSLVLENSEVEVYYNASDSMTPYYNVTCVAGQTSQTSFLCPAGVNTSLTCDGVFEGILYVQCPYYYTEPICADLRGASATAESCTVTSFDGNMTACDCVNSTLTGVFPTVSSYSSVGSMQFVTITQEILETPDSTFTTYFPSSQPSAQPSSSPTGSHHENERYYSYRYPIFVVFVTLIVVVLGACCIFFLMGGTLGSKEGEAIDGSSIALRPISLESSAMSSHHSEGSVVDVVFPDTETPASRRVSTDFESPSNRNMVLSVEEEEEEDADAGYTNHEHIHVNLHVQGADQQLTIHSANVVL
jgi:hypothetical protein